MQEPASILVAVDGSPSADKAVDAAVLLAKSSGAVLQLLYVSYFDSETDDEAAERISWLPESVVGSASRQAQAILDHAAEHIPAGVKFRCHRETGNPAKKIVEFAEKNGSDMIVVGGRGLGLVERFLMGSVSQAVMEAAKCTVIVVK